MTLRSCGQVPAIQVQTLNSENASDSVPALRQSGEHSSCATNSVDRFSGNTVTDAEHQEDPQAH